MADEKDRFGDKLHDAEKAREDKWAREQDQLLLEKLRQKHSAELHCPQCAAELASRPLDRVAVMACPEGHGAWLDHDALEQIARR
jgi:hypothetical protein